MVSDRISVRGDLDITLYDEFGNIKQHLEVPNLIVTVGKNHIASRLVGVTSNVMSYMALGTSSTTPSVGDTGLNAEIASSRTGISLTNSNNTIIATATFGAGVGTSATVQEAGLFNASTGGTMLAHTTFPALNKSSSDTLSVNWTITIA